MRGSALFREHLNTPEGIFSFKLGSAHNLEKKLF